MRGSARIYGWLTTALRRYSTDWSWSNRLVSHFSRTATRVHVHTGSGDDVALNSPFSGHSTGVDWWPISHGQPRVCTYILVRAITEHVIHHSPIPLFVLVRKNTSKWTGMPLKLGHLEVDVGVRGRRHMGGVPETSGGVCAKGTAPGFEKSVTKNSGPLPHRLQYRRPPAKNSAIIILDRLGVV